MVQRDESRQTTSSLRCAVAWQHHLTVDRKGGKTRLTATALAAAVTEEIYCAIIEPVCHLLLHSTEPQIGQSCCEVLRKFLEAGGAAMFTWHGATEQQTIVMLHTVFEAVLRPDADDRAAAMAAGLALQTLLALQGRREALAPRLLQLLIAKMLTCQTHALRGQLLVVITRYAPLRRVLL
jgi:hypothetical protein